MGNDHLVMAPNRDVLLRFQVGIGGIPVGGARTEFSLVGAPADALLGSDSLITDNDGTVSVRLRAGSTNGSFRVRMSTEGADPVFIDVDITGSAAGNVVVRTGYTGSEAVDHYEVRLHDGRGACSTGAGGPATVQHLSVPANLDARFNNLTAGASYSASVRAIAADGHVVAESCGGATSVVAQRDAIINVHLSPPPAPPASWFGGFLDDWF